MITEGFIDSCFKLLLSRQLPFKGEASLFRDIESILNEVSNKKNFEIPLQLKNKFDILNTIVKMRLGGKTPDLIFDSVIINKNTKQYENFLQYILQTKFDKKELDNCATQVLLRKKFTMLMSNYDVLTTFLDKINNGSYSSLDVAINKYEDLVRSMFINLSDVDKHKSIECGSSLNLEDDDYEPLVKNIIEFSCHENSVPTGFSVLDKQIMHGGFEPLRLYLIAGGSGSGKSTLLLNLIKNASILTKKKQNEKPVFLYVTLENTLEESFLRLYQAISETTAEQAVDNMKNGLDIKSYVKNYLSSGSNIIMNYFPAGSTSVSDIAAKIDDIQSRENQKVKAVYVDYLDFLKSDRLYENRRHELGFITLCLKVLAVDYQIPVIAPTQLNRAVYLVKSASELNQNMVGESIQKLENSDFVMMTAKSQTDPNIVLAKIVKFRNGPSNGCLQFNVDFERYLFKACTKENGKSTNVDSSMLLNNDLNFGF